MAVAVVLGVMLAVAAIGMFLASPASGVPRANPADHPRLVDQRLDPLRYDHAKGCRRGARRGTRALRAWLDRHVRGELWGINRCERLGSRGRPHALARRMGVQGLIFNCRQWYGSPSGLGRYSYCFRPNGKRRRNLDRTQAHMDHLHIELNWRGARMRTSFWRSPLADR